MYYKTVLHMLQQPISNQSESRIEVLSVRYSHHPRPTATTAKQETKTNDAQGHPTTTDSGHPVCVCVCVHVCVYPNEKTPH